MKPKINTKKTSTRISASIFRLFIISTFAFIFFSCNSTRTDVQPTPLESYYGYISNVTSGVIKRSEPVVIRFANDVAQASQIGNALPRNTFKISPSVKGEARFVSANTIEFVPEQAFAWNTKYTVNLNLGNIINVPDQLSMLAFSFQTTEKAFSVSVSGLEIDPENTNRYSLSGTINTPDEFENADVEKLIGIKHNNTGINPVWEHSPKAGKHVFVLKNIERTETQGELTIEWNGRQEGASNIVGKKTITVPSLSDFSISSVRVVNAPDQLVEVVFSDPLNMDADYRGLITLDHSAITRVQASNNILRIYPNTRLSGEYTLDLNPVIMNTRSIKLNKTATYSLHFGNLKPEVRLLGSGVIVPQNKGLHFPFEATGLLAVDVRITKIFTNNIHTFLQNNSLDYSYGLNRVGRVIHRSKVELTGKGAAELNQWNAFNIDISKLIEVETGAIYNVEIGFRKSYSLYQCPHTDNIEGHFVPVELEDLVPGNNYSTVYFSHHYNWQLYDDPCNFAYYSPYRFVNRNIYGSDHGIIAKSDALGKTYVFVSNLVTALPETGAEVQLYDYQNQLLNTATTNSEGMVSVTCEREPFLIVTRKGNSIGYLKTDYSTLLSTSTFDVSGRDVRKGIKGFIFGERDVWRPGDSVYVSFILEDKLGSLPNGHPLLFEVRNPAGQLVHRMLRQRDNKSIYPFFFSTAPDAPTGNWQVVVNAGTVQFNKTVRIETVKPNRLKIELKIDDEILSANRKSSIEISSAWMHGTPARNLNARVDVAFSPHTPTFKNFTDFDFSTPYNNFNGQEITIFDNKLDNNGNMRFNFDFTPNNEVSGFLRASFTTRVFEPGGEFSINYMNMPFSPYKNYVGLKIDWSYKNWNKLNNNESHIINVVTVNENGNPADLKGIDVKLYELDYRWWYQSNNENLAAYAGKTYHKPVYSSKLSTQNGKATFTINSNEERWGRHLLLVTSPDGHTAGQVIYFGWPWGREQHTGGAQMLALVAEKDKFKTGEKITVSFPASPAAKALITIESGSEILAHEWIGNLSEYTHYTFEAKPEMAPNIYVHVMLVQPHAQTANDLPIRLYGILPINIEDENTRLKPKIEIPAEVRPQKEFTVRVSEENRQPMEYILAIVDEGLLNITNFRTPDPWASFYAREALGIKTFDMYNHVMGAFGSRLESMFAVGGSDAVIDNSKKSAERFKPVVKVLGPFKLGARERASHKVTLPQYIGETRVMLIAANNGKYGHTHQALPVREPLMVLSTLPRVLSPADKVDVPVTVFVTKNNIKNVKVSVETNEMLELTGASTQHITFSEIGEKDIYFGVKAAGNTGIAKLKVSVEAANESSYHEIEIDIREPNPPTVQNLFKVLGAGEKWTNNIEAIGLPATQKASIELSSVPPLNLRHRLNYLISYPHGCIEQIVSAAFPQLYLPVLSKLNEDELSRVKRNVEKCISDLQRYQLPGGGFAYWPGGIKAESWSTCYTGFFILEAEKSGYLVPSNIKQQLLNKLRNEASNYSPPNNQNYQHYIQAYRLYLLALAGEPHVPGMNRLRAVSALDNQTKWMLAGAYALSGMKEAAYQLTDFRQMEPGQPHNETFGSYLRDQSVILTALLAMGENEQAWQKANEVSQQLSSGEWLSTQSTAYALVALAQFIKQTQASGKIDFSTSINGSGSRKESNLPVEIIDIGFDAEGNALLEISNHTDGNLFVNILNTGIRPGVDTGYEAKGIEIESKYLSREMQTINPAVLTRGSDFIALVTVRNKTATAIENLALSQMVPAGWEILNTRLAGNGSNTFKNDAFDYQDIRDDRVYTYFALPAYGQKTFSIQLTAAYSGTYLMPSVSCEAMYNNMYYAREPGRIVEVISE